MRVKQPIERLCLDPFNGRRVGLGVTVDSSQVMLCLGISDWLTASSRMRRTPLGKDRVLIGPWATLLPVAPESTDWPDLS